LISFYLKEKSVVGSSALAAPDLLACISAAVITALTFPSNAKNVFPPIFFEAYINLNWLKLVWFCLIICSLFN
jgi:hypothetical protein